MKHDQSQFAAAAAAYGGQPQPRVGPNASAARAYRGETADRVRRFLPMVRRLAWHVHGSGREGLELEDLMQAGLVALTECAQNHANNHTGEGEDGFAAYAKMRVRGAMIDMIRRTVPLSRGATERRKAIRDQETLLRGRLGRDPTEPELAEIMGISLEDLAHLRNTSEPLRFEALDETYSDSSMAFADEAPDSLALLEDQEMRESLIEAIAELPERLQVITQLYFVEELNLSEIAQVLDVSIPRVHQLKAQALEKLRAAISEKYDIV